MAISYTNIVNSLKNKFALKSWVTTQLSGKQDSLTASTNIQISSDNKISATDTKYTAGDNVQINGTVISATDTQYTLPVATSSTLGGVKEGENITIAEDGTISAEDSYSLPTASDTVKGGIKVGNNLSMSGEVLSAVDTTYSDATQSVHGLLSTADKIKLDSITVANLELITNRKTSVSSSSTDSEYPTSKAVYTAISSAIAGVTQFDYEVVSSLPATGVKGKIYLLANTGETSNFYDEYIWIVVDGTGKFEKIGTTQIDLSNYYTKSETDSAIDTDISTHNSSSSAHSTLLSNYATTTNLSDHIGNTTVHITANERTSWNSRLTESNLQTAFNDLADAIDDME